MTQEIQLEIIKIIDVLEPQFDSKYQRIELKKLRDKYIFKEVPTSEVVTDVKYLKDLKKVTLLKNH
jgi:hypothetical protein